MKFLLLASLLCQCAGVGEVQTAKLHLRHWALLILTKSDPFIGLEIYNAFQENFKGKEKNNHLNMLSVEF
jgi:hypothetical protein